LALGTAAAAGLLHSDRLVAASPPPVHRIRAVPLAEKTSNWCGPAALAAVLNYHGETVSAQEIAEEIYLPHHRGSLNLDLLIYAREHGFEACAGEGSRAALKEAVSRDRPVVCMLRKHSLLVGRNHFVVVRGYNAQKQLWFIDSGNGKEETVTGRDFLRGWQDCGNWMLVVEDRKKAESDGSDATN